VGDKTVGVAISDALGITAQGMSVIERIGIRKDTTKILETIIENNCSRVVIGLPINLNGTDSVQTQKVRDFAEALENKLRSNAKQDVEIVLFDERFTTKLAAQIMINAGVRREKRKEVIDKQAAVVILQDYLETARRKSEA
jgi:putative Holliday junction resolvase